MHAYITIAGIEPDAGGPSRSVPSLAQHIAMQGVKVRLISVGNVAICEEGISYCLDLYKYDKSFISKIKAINKMRRDLSAEVHKYAGRSIIHDQGIWLMSNHASVGVARKNGTPLILSPRGMLEPWSLNYKAIKKKTAWSLYQKRDLEAVDLFHVTSQLEADNVQKLFRKPVAIIPNGIDLPQMRERKRLDSGARTILFLSRINQKKGLLNLVSAWAKIQAPGWRIVIVGPDESGHRREVEEAIRNADIQEYFEFVGPVDDVAKWDWYFKADLFVLPTFSENFGIVIAEALACGVPVITTKGTPWQELNINKCGWWIDIGVNPLIDALQEAIALSDESRNEMGKRGRALVEDGYSWEKIGKDMTDVYSWILGNGSKPETVHSP